MQKKGKAPLKQPGPISVSSCKGVNDFLEKHILTSQKPCLQWPVTVANCSTVTKHINANALLYPSLQPDYQKSRSYFPALDNFHRRLSGPIQPNPSIQNYLWWNSSYFKTTFDKTADISAGFTSKIVIKKKKKINHYTMKYFPFTLWKKLQDICSGSEAVRGNVICVQAT